MILNTALFVSLGENMALLLSLVFLYSTVIPFLKNLPSTAQQFIIGLLFGIIALLGMRVQIEVTTGISIDSRVVIVAIASVFGGFRAGLTAGSMVSLYRYSLGGIGTTAGIGAIIVGALIGGIFRYRWYAHLTYMRHRHFLLLGIALAIQGLLWVFVMPLDIAIPAFEKLAFPILLFYPFATLFFGVLFSHELARNEAEKTLESERGLLRTIIDTSPNYIYVKDLNGQFILSNIAQTKKLGKTSVDEVIGKNDFAFHTTEKAEQVQANDATIMNTKEPVMNQLEEDHSKSDQTQWFLTSKIPLKDTNGKVNGLLSIAHDFTERKQAEDIRLENERLTVALEKEKELADLKEQFMSTITHELRTPLTSIMLGSEKLKLHWEKMSVEMRETNLDRLINQAQQLDNLISEISTSMQASRGYLNYVPAQTNLITICEGCMEKIDGMRSNQHVLFTHEGQFDSVYIDGKLMDHAIMNLLTNALKYMPDGGTVEFKLSCTDDNIIIQIADEGIGISETDQAYLFSPFFRGENVGGIRGTGVGLSIVKEIVELHGGTITCESTINVGTTFTITIPLRR